jgi:hypothetical protein|tara:strand:+ start:73 stop:324 length:252 start_codon:yes stop_codon:yes gene_type:complete
MPYYDSVNLLKTNCTVEWDGDPGKKICSARGGELIHPGWPLQRDVRARTRRLDIDRLGSIRYDQPGRRVSDGKFPRFTEQWIS